MKWPLLAAVVFALLVCLPAAAATPSYKVTVQTNSSSYVGGATVSVSGQVSPAPGPNTAVYIKVVSPSDALVTAMEASVNGTTGSYSASFVAGGSASWVDGSYVVNATWGAYGSPTFAVTDFGWSGAGTTSTTGTSSTASSTSSTNSTSTQGTSTSGSSSSSGGGGGIPEFPLQALAVATLTVLVVVSYLLVSRRGGGVRARARLRPA